MSEMGTACSRESGHEDDGFVPVETSGARAKLPLQLRRAPIVQGLRQRLAAAGETLDEYPPLAVDQKVLRERAGEQVRKALGNMRRSSFTALSDKSTPALDLRDLQYKTLSLAGGDHLFQQLGCQDAIECDHDEHAFIAAIAHAPEDAPLAGSVAKLLTLHGAAMARTLLNAKLVWTSGLLHENFLTELFFSIEREMQATAAECGLSAGQQQRLFRRCHLQLLIITPAEALVLGMGSGYLKWRGKYRPMESCSFADDEPEQVPLYIAAHGPSAHVLRTGVAIASGGIADAYEITAGEERDRSFAVEYQLLQNEGEHVSVMIKLFNLIAMPAPAGAKLGIMMNLLQQERGNAVAGGWAQRWRLLLADYYRSVFGLDAEEGEHLRRLPLDELLSGSLRTQRGCYRLLDAEVAKERAGLTAADEALRQHGVDVPDDPLPLRKDLSLILVWHQAAADRTSAARQTTIAPRLPAEPTEKAATAPEPEPETEHEPARLLNRQVERIHIASARPQFKAYEYCGENSRFDGQWDLWSTPDMLRNRAEHEEDLPPPPPKSWHFGSPTEEPAELPPNGSLLKRLLRKANRRRF